MLGHCYKIFKLLTLKVDTRDNVELQTKQSICIFENMIEWIDLILMTMNKIALKGNPMIKKQTINTQKIYF